MIWARIILSAILASELLFRLPLLVTIRRAIGAAEKSARLLRSKRISDHWKEKMLLAYSVIIARNSLLFFGLLCVVILPVLVIGLSYPGGLLDWMSVLVKPLNLGLLCGISVLYLVLRARRFRG